MIRFKKGDVVRVTKLVRNDCYSNIKVGYTGTVLENSYVPFVDFHNKEVANCMKEPDDLSWGQFPKNMKDVTLTEIELIHYWREHNSELLAARAMMNREGQQALGGRLEEKLLFNMKSIVNNIQKYRGARGE